MTCVGGIVFVVAIAIIVVVNIIEETLQDISYLEGIKATI